MDDGPLRERGDSRPGRPAARIAAYGVAVGVIAGAAAVICLAVGAVSAQQAIAIGVPAAMLIIGGLIIAVLRDPAAGERAGFAAGFRVGLLLTRWRSLIRRRRNGH